MSELMSNEAVCRTAPATPGLLIRSAISYRKKVGQKQLIVNEIASGLL